MRAARAVNQSGPSLRVPAPQHVVDRLPGGFQVAGDRLRAPPVQVERHHRPATGHRIGHLPIARDPAVRPEGQRLAGQHLLDGVVADRAVEAVPADARDLEGAERRVVGLQLDDRLADPERQAAADPARAERPPRTGCACRWPRSAPPCAAGSVPAPRFRGRAPPSTARRARSGAAVRRSPARENSPGGGVAPSRRSAEDAAERQPP